MKTLPQKLRKSGHDYVQVQRGRKACIYEQRFHGKLISHEVFLIRISPEREIKGTTIEARERFPHDEAFGYWAWSIVQLDRALKKFNELEESSRAGGE